MPQFLFTPSPNSAAIRFLVDKPVISREIFDRMLPELRGFSFTITGIESLSVLKKARDRLSDLPAGESWDAVKKDIAAEIVPYLGADAGLKRAELLLRVHGYGAYNAAQDQLIDKQRDIYPYWQWQTAQDGRERPAHAALDGKVFPVDWQGELPGQAFGCRCQRIQLSEDDVAEIRINDAENPPEERRVIEGARLEKAQTTGQLMTAGTGQIPRVIDVRSSREKFGPTGLYRKPGKVQIDYDALEQTYGERDPQGWSVFTEWAKKTMLGNGLGSVMDWLTKSKA
jgi:SPP1 gp7 family putative phage head morphogenesis protein